MFFKIESWNFQHLFRDTSQTLNSFWQFLLSFILSVVWLIWNFVRCHEIFFQTDSESFSFLSWKTKKVLFLKKYFLSVVNIKTKKLCLLTQFSVTVLESACARLIVPVLEVSGLVYRESILFWVESQYRRRCFGDILPFLLSPL